MNHLESHMEESASARAIREAMAYDDGMVTETCERWLHRVPHVFSSRNTELGESRFDDLILERLEDARVVELGCGKGAVGARLGGLGAASVLGVDVSQREIEQADLQFGDIPNVSFATQSIEDPLDGEFDLIVGRSILHHVDFHDLLPRLFADNLAPGGRMIFMEPMGHPLTLAFHRFVRSAHTDDEWPITPADVAWMRRQFDATIIPINLLSFPAGVLSSFVMKTSENVLMSLADRADRLLERNRRLQCRGRQGIVVIDSSRSPRIAVARERITRP